MAESLMQRMLKAGVHFGHRSRFWSPKMEKYIYGTRNSVHIINLEKTVPMFTDVLNYVGKIAANGGSILFVGTKRSASKVIKEEAIRCDMPYVVHRWLGGMMTNYKTIKESIKRLKDFEFLAADNFSQFGKKETLMMTREMEKLQRSLGGIKNLGGSPDVIFIIDIGHEKNAVREAQKLNIPIIGVVDTNHNPENIDYVIPGNDDSIRAISFYAREIANAVLEAKAAAGKSKIEKQVKTTIKKNTVGATTADVATDVKAKEEKATPSKDVATEATTESSTITTDEQQPEVEVEVEAKTKPDTTTVEATAATKKAT